MKLFFLLFLSVSTLFSLELDIQDIQKCAKIESDMKRLDCYDSLALKSTITPEFLAQGEVLTSRCILCHGRNWSLSTNGERLVKDMSKKQIHDSLFAYKYKKIDSTVMNFHMSKFSDKEIEQMVKYIIYQINQ